MKFKDRFSNSRCPNCGKYCITYWQKIKLVDYRFSNECKECGGYIKLPFWHIPLYLAEVVLIFYVMVKFKLNAWESVVFGILSWLFINFIQLPFIPIKN